MTLSRLDRSLQLGSRGPFLSPDSDTSSGASSDATSDTSASAGGQSGETSDDTVSEKRVEFSADQQAFVSKLVSRERKLAADKARADAKAEADAAAEQARKDKETEDARKAGDFEKVEATLKAELQAAKDDAAALRGRNDQIETLIEDVLLPEFDALEDDVREFYPGPDDDALAKVTWLPKGRSLQARLHPTKERVPGNGRDPRSSGNSTVDDKAAQAANALRYR